MYLTIRHGKSRLRSRDGMKVPFLSCVFCAIIYLKRWVALAGTVQARWPAPPSKTL